MLKPPNRGSHALKPTPETHLSAPGAADPFPRIDVEAASSHLVGVVRRTPLIAFDCPNPAIDLRLKAEHRQETGSFKARGAWNQVRRLVGGAVGAGIVCTSSGNHGRALSWAARRAGITATVFMPEDAYPNKIQACRDEGAQVVLCPTREECETRCAEAVAGGAILIHPYDAERTLEGAGTVGLEIAEDWPEVEVVVVPVGGGGLISGTSLALKRRLGEGVKVVGAEPVGAPSLTLGLEAGAPVFLTDITTGIQGLCPIHSGQINIDICSRTVDLICLVEDEVILDAQALLVAAGETVEPAGAAAVALVLAERIPQDWWAGRSASDPLRIAAIVSGGNADPEQLAALRKKP
jgi:threonine dehydratase